MINSPAYLIHFPETTAIKWVGCVKFTDSHNISSLSKPDKNTENPEYQITYKVDPKDNSNTKGKEQITRYPIRQRKRPDFFFL